MSQLSKWWLFLAYVNLALFAGNVYHDSYGIAALNALVGTYCWWGFTVEAAKK